MYIYTYMSLNSGKCSPPKAWLLQSSGYTDSEHPLGITEAADGVGVVSGGSLRDAGRAAMWASGRKEPACCDRRGIREATSAMLARIISLEWTGTFHQPQCVLLQCRQGRCQHDVAARFGMTIALLPRVPATEKCQGLLLERQRLVLPWRMQAEDPQAPSDIFCFCCVPCEGLVLRA